MKTDKPYRCRIRMQNAAAMDAAALLCILSTDLRDGCTEVLADEIVLFVAHGLDQFFLDLAVTDADDIADLVPIVVGIQAEAALRLLAVIQLAVAAGQVEAGIVVGQMALAYHINCLVVHLHGDGHVGEASAAIV